MRRLYVPITVLGLAGLGAFFLTDRGRRAIRWVADNFERAPEALLQWNESTQRELERLQSALDQVAESLGTAH